MTRSFFHRFAFCTTLLTLVVVVLGAYVRLSDAGLGCPDWPGCYGLVDVPSGARQIAAANAAYPERPVEPDKAWKEMIHRYLAGLLGLAIAGLAVVAAVRRRHDPGQPLLLPLALVALVIFQAILGMWTVTWQLKPLAVTAHLLGGMGTFALLTWLTLRSAARRGPAVASPALRRWALGGLLVLVLQIALGGWTSSNYAALACSDFPTCQGRWWPEQLDFGQAFVLWRGLGVNYEFGVLDHPARTAIHFTHRLGAMLVLLYIGALALAALNRSERRLKTAGGLLAALLLTQLALGVANVVYSLPLAVAVGHNLTAALLLLALLKLLHLVTQPQAARRSASDARPELALQH